MDLSYFTAAAAMIGAIMGILTYRNQRLNFVESIRPELQPLEWELTGLDDNGLDNLSRPESGLWNGTGEDISFSQIRNVGKGMAHNVLVQICDTESLSELPRFYLEYRIGLLPSQHVDQVLTRDTIDWSKLPAPDEDEETMPGWPTRHYHVLFTYLDANDNQYKVHWIYELTSPLLVCSNRTTNGMRLIRRIPSRCPLWQINLRSWFEAHRIEIRGRIRRWRKRKSKRTPTAADKATATLRTLTPRTHGDC